MHVEADLGVPEQSGEPGRYGTFPRHLAARGQAARDGAADVRLRPTTRERAPGDAGVKLPQHLGQKSGPTAIERSEVDEVELALRRAASPAAPARRTRAVG